MRHKLTVRIMADLQRLGIKATAAMREAFAMLDAMAVRASKAGLSAAGKSGRKRISVDLAEVARLRSEGLSCAAIARQLGVSEATISRAIRGHR